ncbi:polyprenyl synthetase family protein [Enterococcus sp. LJL98]
MTLEQFQKRYLTEVETEMVRFLSEQTVEATLRESMLYSIQAGGKRIRPLLLLVVAASFKPELERGTIQVAAALEMIHTYSLIHDDLPAMDNDDLRRGKPTNHKVYGDAVAILAGDGLLTMAFQLLSQAQLDANKKVLLLQLLAQTAGSHGMVAGQVADILGEGQSLSLEELVAIHQRKTGELIRFSLLAGGILTDQSRETLAHLERLALHLGLAFQVRDDILDVISDAETLGKATQKDAALEKNTYPGLLGLSGAKEALQAEMRQASQVLENLTKMTFNPALMSDLFRWFELENEGEEK